MAALDTTRDRLAAARALGLSVPDELDDAASDEIDRALRSLAQARFADIDERIDARVRERAALAAAVLDSPHGHA